MLIVPGEIKSEGGPLIQDNQISSQRDIMLQSPNVKVDGS